MSSTVMNHPPATQSKARGPYSARLVRPRGEIEELYHGYDVSLATEAARRAHEGTGYRAWVWNVRSGKTVLRFGGAPDERAAERRRVGGEI